MGTFEYELQHTVYAGKEAGGKQPSCSHEAGLGSADTYRDQYRRYPTPMGRVPTLEDEELFLPDHEVQGTEAPDTELLEFDQIEGLIMQMTRAMNHNHQEEQRCFMCGATNHFAHDCPHWEMFPIWHREHLNSKGSGPKNKEPT